MNNKAVVTKETSTDNGGSKKGKKPKTNTSKNED